jgi:hypothetical protein
MLVQTPTLFLALALLPTQRPHLSLAVGLWLFAGAGSAALALCAGGKANTKVGREQQAIYSST